MATVDPKVDLTRGVDTGRFGAEMTYGVQMVRDDDFAEGVEWLLIEEPERLVLLVAVSSFCARVVAEGMAAVGRLMARRAEDAAA